MQRWHVLTPRMQQPRRKVMFAAIPVGWVTRCLSLGKSKVRRFGPDFSGVVVELGSGLTTLSAGAEVYAMLDYGRDGAEADYTIVGGAS